MLACLSLIGMLFSAQALASCEGFGIGSAGLEGAEERQSIRGQFADNDFAGEVLFAPGSAELSPEARERLRTWLNCLQSEGIPVFETYIVGHTDITGHADPRIRRQRNQELSEERARSVYRWLQSLGFRAQGEVTAIGRGESEPLCVPGPGESWTPELHRCNRRVEIFISSVEDFDPLLLAEALGLKLDWESDPTRSRFDLGEAVGITATLHHPGGFDPRRAPEFTLIIGEREMYLSPDRRPVDGENWRARGQFELDRTGRFEINVAATLGQKRAEGRSRTIEVELPEYGLQWQIDPEGSRFDVGQAMSVTAELNNPGGFDTRRTPQFTLHLGEREFPLRSDRRPVDEENWRATGQVELDEPGRFELNVQVMLDPVHTEGRPRTIDVEWPEYGLALQPVWNDCPACDASTASVIVDDLPARGFIDVLPIEMYAETEPVQVELQVEGLPEGIRLVGPGRISLDHASPSTTVELTRTRLAQPLIVQAGRNYQPDLGERSTFRLILAHLESGAAAELELYLERAHEFGLHTDEAWSIDLATMMPGQHRISPVVDGQRIHVEPGFELSLDGLPAWSSLRPVDEDHEAWVIDYKLPWWMSPAFITPQTRVIDASLLVGDSVRTTEQFQLNVQSSVPRWRLWLNWLLKVIAILLVLLWLFGMWRKPRFDKSASITRENPTTDQSVPRQLRASWISRFVIPFKPEKARLFGLTWLAGTSRGHVRLLCPRGVHLEVDGQEKAGAGERAEMIFANQAVSIQGRPYRFYYEVR